LDTWCGVYGSRFVGVVRRFRYVNIAGINQRTPLPCPDCIRGRQVVEATHSGGIYFSLERKRRQESTDRHASHSLVEEFTCLGGHVAYGAVLISGLGHPTPHLQIKPD
jgi:hypothetical protein